MSAVLRVKSYGPNSSSNAQLWLNVTTRITCLAIVTTLLSALGCDSGSNYTTSPSQQTAGQDSNDAIEVLPMAIQQEPFGKTKDGEAVTRYLMTNGKGMTVGIINYGATVTDVVVPDRDGETSNVVLAFDDLPAYEKNAPYFGAICGRYANRIANAKFTLDGEEYQLAANNPPNHLHGGEKGFHHAVWHAEPISDTENGNVRLVLNYVSPDGEDGYPGTLKTTVTYKLNDQNELHIDYAAVLQGDKPTVLNLTNHCYWNLASGGTILDHNLQLFCDKYIPVDETGIPTGELKAVAQTPMDFLTSQSIGSRIEQVSGGYDHCYVTSGEKVTIDKQSLQRVARLHEPTTGRVMEIFSTEPGVQFYTGNFLNGSEDHAGFNQHEALCLECQHFPDSPNRPEFPTTVLKPGEVYTQRTVHRFLADKPSP